VENKLVWTGDLPALQMSQHLQVVDIYIHTGSDGVSGRSTSLASALAHGLPIIGYRGSETPQWLADSGAVILSAPGDVKGLAEAFRRLSESPALRSELGYSARRVFDERMSWSVIAQQLMAPL
jgi:glycosyltransferase involved in cell wall biosynthesis